MPSGGRWKYRDRDTDTVTLSSPESETPRSAWTLLGAAEALRIATLYAGRVGTSTTSVDELEDLAQEALVSILTRRRSDLGTGFTPGLIAKAVAGAVASAIGARPGAPPRDGAVSTTLLDRRLDRGRVESLDGEAWREAIRVAADDSDEARTGAHELADAVEEGVIDTGRARLRVWDALASHEALPFTKRGSIDLNLAFGIRQTVMAVGGVTEIARRYLDDGVLDSEMLGVMQPFSAHRADDAAVVAGFLVSRARVAQHLWDCALEAASH